MMNNQIIEKLTTLNNSQDYPYEAMEAAILNPEGVIPELLNVLDEAYEEGENFDSDNWLILFGPFLLAQFQEPKAFPKLIKLLELDKESVVFLLGDMLTESYMIILRSTYDGDYKLLQKVIENDTLHKYARNAALQAYSFLMLDGMIERTTLIDYLDKLMSSRDEDMVTFATSVALDCKLAELLPQIKEAYKENRVDEMWCNYSGLIDYMFTKEKMPKTLIENAIDETHNWAAFNQAKREKSTPKLSDKNLAESFSHQQTNPHKGTSKVGRNDPCPCGSKKKFKKCCLNKPVEKPVKKEIVTTETIFEKYFEENLKKYPQENAVALGSNIKFGDIFDKEAIEIDRYLYSALKQKFGFLNPKPKDYDRFVMNMLLKAYHMQIEKMQREGIESFMEYDEKYQVHYSTSRWIWILEELLDEYEAHSQVIPLSIEESYKKYNDNLKLKTEPINFWDNIFNS